ncbi:hypothetical protein STEG23_031370 [Scotinomys teguina]
MMTSRPELMPKAMSGSVALQLPGSALMSKSSVTNEGHVDVPSLNSHLNPCRLVQFKPCWLGHLEPNLGLTTCRSEECCLLRKLGQVDSMIALETPTQETNMNLGEKTVQVMPAPFVEDTFIFSFDFFVKYQVFICVQIKVILYPPVVFDAVED